MQTYQIALYGSTQKKQDDNMQFFNKVFSNIAWNMTLNKKIGVDILGN